MQWVVLRSDDPVHPLFAMDGARYHPRHGDDTDDAAVQGCQGGLW
jgi:hypothetical protein